MKTIKNIAILLTVLTFVIANQTAKAIIGIESLDYYSVPSCKPAPDTTRINISGKKTILIIDKDEENSETLVIKEDSIDVDTTEHKHKNKFEGHWAGLEVGLNNYMNSAQTFDLDNNSEFMKLNPGKSWAFSLNFVEFNFGLYKSYVGLTTGLGLEFNNYRFAHDYTLTSGNTIGYFSDSTRVISKNKLATSYLNVPLLLEFQIPTGKDKGRINIGVGGYAGVLIGSHTKQVFTLNGTEYKDKAHEDYNLNPWKYGVTARIGFGGVQLFANYSLSTLFEENKGPELYPVSFGIRLLNL